MVDYADPYTRRKLQRGQQQGVVLVTPDALPSLGKIMDAIVGHQDPDRRLQLVKLRMVRLTELQVSGG